MGVRPPLRLRVGRLSRSLGIGGYIGAIALVAAALLAIPLSALAAEGLGVRWLSVLGVLGAIPAIDAAVALVNRIVARGFGATLLPGAGTPRRRSAAPAHARRGADLLTTPEAVEEQIERLEIHHLASADGDLHFALLSDWVDADTEHDERDDALLAAAAAGIAQLNRRYGPAPAGDRFLLLHRRRVWNQGEGRWIGWERKRGKLHELNRLLRGATDTTFLDVHGQPPAVPPDVRYVITLDADTRLPRETVRRLIGKMAHPLNRPRLDAVAGRVVEGYAVLQPRVTPSLPVGREGSLFQRIFSSMSGIDPYASAVSDVYQDLFGEGSYTGKGIYDVDAFEAALAGRVPDSTLLSHDLFEGVFARAGLASDVEVVEEFPARYDVAAVRHHRWARGDWQLLPWIIGRGRGTGPAGGPRARRDPGDRPLEDARQPAADAVGARRGRGPGGRDAPCRSRALSTWIAFVLVDDRDADADPDRRHHRAAPPRDHGAQPAASARRRSPPRRDAVGPADRLPRSPGVADERRDRTHPSCACASPTGTCWNGCRTAQAAIDPRLGLIGFYRRMAAAPIVAAVAVAVAALWGHGTWPLAAAFAVLVGRVTRHRASGEHLSAGHEPAPGVGRGRPRAGLTPAGPGGSSRRS